MSKALNTSVITSKGSSKRSSLGDDGMSKVESDFDSGHTVNRNSIRVVKTIELNGKLFNVVDFS
jgi:hypothetical protein